MKKVAKKTAKKTAKKVAKKVTKKVTKKPAKKMVKKPAKKVAKKSAPVKKAVKKVVKKTVKPVVKKPVKAEPTAKELKKIEQEKSKALNAFRKLSQTRGYSDFLKFVDILAQRWDAEKTREDFDSYIKFLEGKLPEGLKLVKMFKDFTLMLKYGNVDVVINTTPRLVNQNIYFVENLK